MTSRPAARVGLHDRGILRPGMAADITVFDPGDDPRRRDLRGSEPLLRRRQARLRQRPRGRRERRDHERAARAPAARPGLPAAPRSRSRRPSPSTARPSPQIDPLAPDDLLYDERREHSSQPHEPHVARRRSVEHRRGVRTVRNRPVGPGLLLDRRERQRPRPPDEGARPVHRPEGADREPRSCAASTSRSSSGSATSCGTGSRTSTTRSRRRSRRTATRAGTSASTRSRSTSSGGSSRRS